MLEIRNEELRLEVMKGNKKKTYLQSKIPMKRVLEYTEGEIDRIHIIYFQYGPTSFRNGDCL